MGKGKEQPSRGSDVPEIKADLTVGTTRSKRKNAIPERKPGSSPFHPQPDELAEENRLKRADRLSSVSQGAANCTFSMGMRILILEVNPPGEST